LSPSASALLQPITGRANGTQERNPKANTTIVTTVVATVRDFNDGRNYETARACRQ
jgi:hypothetical protein